jgi:hypothetical protein
MKYFTRYPRPPSGHPESIRSRKLKAGVPLTPLEALDVRFYRRIKALNAEDRAVLETAIRIRYESDRRKILERNQ